VGAVEAFAIHVQTTDKEQIQMTDTQLPMVQQKGDLAVADVMRQHALIQSVIKEVMIPGHHYGVIPGTEAKQGEKPRPPVLLKPGAEKLCMVFRLAASFSERTKDLPNGHREERVTCTLTHIPTGVVVAAAMGSCSTMEAKYRYRNGKPVCPQCGVEAINKDKGDRGGWYCWAKKGGCGAQFPASDKRISEQKVGLAENRDLADTFNTVLKMAVKRAHVAATLLATAASDAFIVEEDAHGDEDRGEPEESPQPKQQPKREAAKGAEKLTPKQELARDCARMVSQLDWNVEEVKAALAENGVVAAFEKWSDLDESTLQKARKMFEGALKAGAPAGGAQP